MQFPPLVFMIRIIGGREIMNNEKRNNSNNEKTFYTTVECIHRVYGCIWRKHYKTYAPNTERFLKKAKIDISVEISSLLRELVEVEDIKKYLPDTDVYVTNNFWNEHPIPYEKLMEVDLLDVYLKNDTNIPQEAVYAIDDMDECNDIDELIKFMHNMIGTDTNTFMCLYKEFMRRIHDDSFMKEYDIYKVPFINNREFDSYNSYLKITNNGKKMTRLSFKDGRVEWVNKPNDLRHIKNEDGEFWFDKNGNEKHAFFPENYAFDENEEWHDSDGNITHRKYGDSEIWYNKGEVIKQRNIRGIGVTNKYVRNRTCERITDTSKPGITKEKWINGDRQVTLSYTRDLRKNVMTSEFIFNYNSDVLIIDEKHKPIKNLNHYPENNRTYIEYMDGSKELYGRDGVMIYKKNTKEEDVKHRPYKRKQRR